MPDILHRVTIDAPAARVFDLLATPQGLAAWWAAAAHGEPEPGAVYTLDFGTGQVWTALVAAIDPPRWVEWELMDGDDDWAGTRLGARVGVDGGLTAVDFYHTGWRHANEPFRTANTRWAWSLRILRRLAEHGDVVPYDQRLDA